MANLQQASTSGTQSDKAPVYDSSGSAKVQLHDNCYNDEIFNIFTQEEHYTELLEPIPEPHQVQQNDSNVTSLVSSVEQGGRTVEQHPANIEETCVLGLKVFMKLLMLILKTKCARVESSDEESLGEENASKQERKITDIDADKGITLVDETAKDQGRFDDQDMFDIMIKDITTAGIEETVSTAAPITTAYITPDELTIAQVLVEIKKSKPKGDKVVIKQEPEQGATTITTTVTIPTPDNTRPKARGVVMQEPTRRLQAEIDEQDRLAEEKAQHIKDENLAWDNVQAMMDADYKLAARLQEEEQGELTIEEKSRLHLKNKSFNEVRKAFDKTMSWINSFVPMDSEAVKDKAVLTQAISSKREGDKLDQERSKKQKLEDDKESEELKRCLEIIPDDGGYENSHMYLTFSKILKNFDREDLEVLWRLVKDRFIKFKPVDDMDSFLLHTLKTMFEHHVEDTVWKSQQVLTKVKNWKLFDSCGVHCVTMQNILYYLLVEKMYPLTNHTLH
nr:hypothetical protein [Tanacetum cinerariifolium]